MSGLRFPAAVLAISLVFAGCSQPADACPIGQKGRHACCQQIETAVVEESCCAAPQATPGTDAGCQCSHPQQDPDAIINQLSAAADGSNASSTGPGIARPVDPEPACCPARIELSAGDRPPAIFLIDCAFLI
jgi:hypothetical protein